MSELSNSQASAAEEIRSLLSAADAMERQSIDNQLDAGHQLVAAKAACGHGSWLPFLARAGVQERRAQRLMKLARSGLKSVTVSDLGGIVKALEFLTRRNLPDGGQGMVIRTHGYMDDTAILGLLLPSLQFPGHWWLAAIHDDGCTYTPRPFPAQPQEFEGEPPFYMVWHWLEKNMTAPIAEWRFEEEDPRLVAHLFSYLDVRAAEAEAENVGHLANATGLHLLGDQIEHYWPEARQRHLELAA